MPRPAASLLAVLLGAAATIALASCGEEDAQLLPGGTAREITANLDTVRLLADEGDCVGAESAAQQVSEQVDALGGVDRRLKQALREGASRLNEVVAGCEEETVEAIEPAIEPPETEEEEPPHGKAKGHEKKPSDETTTSRPEPETPPETPPASPGKEDEAPPPEEEPPAEGPSGGLSPSSPAGGGE